MKYFKIKLKSAALQYALLIAVLVAILLSSFLLLNFTHQKFKHQSYKLLDRNSEMNNGIYYALNKSFLDNDSLARNTSVGVNIIREKAWGNFLLITSTFEGSSSERNALVGHQNNSGKSLMLQEPNLPLVLIGNASLGGSVYLSKHGIKPGSIGGYSYYNKTLINGSVFNAKNLPKLDPKWLKNSKDRLLNQELEKHIWEPFKVRDYTNSFNIPTTRLISDTTIVISSTIVGNILIKSNVEIIVTPNAIINESVLIAPRIKILRGSEFKGHLLANEQVILEEDVKLLYPSSIALLHSSEANNASVKKGEEPIIINKNSLVEGSILYYSTTPFTRTSNSSILIKNKAKILGEVYSTNSIELEGEVTGTVYAYNLVVNKFDGSYINYFYNGKLNSFTANMRFSGLPLENKNKSVAKWLY